MCMHRHLPRCMVVAWGGNLERMQRSTQLDSEGIVAKRAVLSCKLLGNVRGLSSGREASGSGTSVSVNPASMYPKFMDCSRGGYW